MNSAIRGNIQMAFASLRNARWRSGLTIFGVVVAVVPVLVIIGIGEGVKRQIISQIEVLGTDIITVRPGNFSAGAQPLEHINGLSGQAEYAPLAYSDYQVIEGLETVDEAAPLSVVPGEVTIQDKKTDANVFASTESLPDLLQLNVQHGDFFTDKQYGQNAAVIGRGTAEDLFGEGVPLGRAFDFRGETFIIRGILQRSSAIPFAATTDLNNAIIISYNNAKELMSQSPAISQIIVKADEQYTTSEAVRDITKHVRQSHGGEQDFSVVTQAENLRVVSNVMTLLTALVSGVAAIALLVSGISIMNIMLVSVTERMHEIGIRKAIGATKRQILDQFMVEAVLLSAAGGLIGVVVAYGIAMVLRIFTPINPLITWEAAVLVFLLSVLVGMIFGSVPAIKAARKDPIEALRYE